MKIIRYTDSTGSTHFGVQQPDGSRVAAEGDPFAGGLRPTDRAADVAKLLAPVAPPNVFCIGLNYRRHAQEAKQPVPEFPVVFMKGTNAVCGNGHAIELPKALPCNQVDYECELAVVIGAACKNATRKTALQYVLGYTCANDVSSREWQFRRGGTQWSRGKTFDTFCPLGPCLVTADELKSADGLSIKTTLNGQVVQDWDTGDMIFDVPALIEFLSAGTTLLPGTVILTGTPHGVGMARQPPLWMKPGDTVSVEIEGIGELSNPIALEK